MLEALTPNRGEQKRRKLVDKVRSTMEVTR